MSRGVVLRHGSLGCAQVSFVNTPVSPARSLKQDICFAENRFAISLFLLMIFKLFY